MLPLYPWTDYSKMNKGLKWIIDKLNHLKAKDVEYDNTDSGLEAENVQDAIDELQEEIENIGPGGTPSAADVTYDNSESGLEAENVQDAIDELANGGGTYELPIATDTRLGGIKVGARLTIDPETGVLSADDQTQPAPEPTWNVRYFDNVDGSDDNDGLTSATPKKTLYGILSSANDYINIIIINSAGSGITRRELEISPDTFGSTARPVFTKHIKITPYYEDAYPYILTLSTFDIAEGASIIVRNTDTDLSATYNESKTLTINQVGVYGLLDIIGGKQLAITQQYATQNVVSLINGGVTKIQDCTFSGGSNALSVLDDRVELKKCIIVFTGSTGAGNAFAKNSYGTGSLGLGTNYPLPLLYIVNTRFLNSSGYFPTGAYFAEDNIVVIHQNDNVATYGLPSTAFKSNFSIN